MKITFFGSSHGVPEANRHCSCAMITVGDGEGAARYFIDMGMQAADELVTRNIQIESVRAVFITHMHGDHTNGIISFADLCNWYFTDASPRLFFPEAEAIDAMKAWIRANGNLLRDGIGTETVSEGEVYDDGVLRVSAYRTRHSKVSFAYLVEAEGKRVLFTGDLKGPTVDFPCEAARGGLDLVICECAHFSAAEYAKVFPELSVRRAVVNHYPPNKIASVYELAEQVAPLPVALANDGMELEL